MSGLYNWVTSAATPTDTDDAAATPPPPPEDAVRRSTRARAVNRHGLTLPPPEPRRLSPQTPIMDADAIRALVQETLRASSIAAVQASTTTVQEILPDAVRNAVRDQVRDVTALTRKPELPSFDTANIEIWIRRVENAFTRASINNVKDKFAFLESKIGVNSDPKITEYLCVDPPTNATWISFLAYLRKRYGRTKRQQITSLITGTEFDGLQPSAVCALMKEKAGQVTVDDIIKEHIYRRLPIDLQRQLAQEAETMTSTELSELADSFYDKDGRPIHTASNSSVNTIGGGDSNPFNPNVIASAPSSSSNADSFTSAFQDDYSDINVVRAKQAQKQRFNNNNNARPQGSSNSNSRASSNNNNNNARNNKREPLTNINSSGICGYHEKFGVDAFKCASGCKRWAAFQQKNARANSK